MTNTQPKSLNPQQNQRTASTLETCFSPKPRTWWRWLNGNISREGITRDLEAIAEKGFCGVTLFNLGGFYPEGPVRFMSAEWRELFDFAVEECARLGLDFSFKHCDGWGASGGPWIELEDSMKWLVSSKITVDGGERITCSLPQPFTQRGFYRDVKVLAYPAFDAVELPFDPTEIEVTCPGWMNNAEALLDGELHTTANFGFKGEQPQHLDFLLPQETELAGIALYHGPRESVVGPMRCRLSQSADGEHFEPVAEIEMDQASGSVSFPTISARHLRLEILEWSKNAGDGRWAFLAAVEFLPPGGRSGFSVIPNFMMKAAFWHRRTPLGTAEVDPEAPCIDPAEVRDLTAQMDASGKLSWDAPPGRWTILRFGYTTTGHQNGPATDEGRGLECDKLDPRAVDKFFAGYAAKMLDANAAHCGSTITRIFHDSFEAGVQNWTPALPEEFRRRRGYGIWDWLPVFAGEYVGSPQNTERFLYDLRRTLSEMLCENYYARLSALAESKGVRLLVQSAGEQQMMINPIAYSRHVSIPSTEFWIGTTADSSGPYDGRPLVFYTNGSVYDAVSASKHMGISVLPGESFTTKLTDYSITPRVLKRIGSQAFAAGFNQLEMHTYIHQPKEDFPGLQHYMFGIAFGRKVTWWKHADTLAKYFERIQKVLQSGPTVADVLVYTGEEIPRSLEYAYGIEEPSEIIPPGYAFDTCDRESLLDWVTTTRDGRLLVNGQHEYRVLLLPPDQRMSLDVLHKIREIVEAGVPVLGPKPTHTFGLEAQGDEAELRTLAEDLWNPQRDRAVSEGESPREFIQNRLEPDFTCEGLEVSREILYQHRLTAEGDVYFVANVLEEPRKARLSFRQDEGWPTILDPETGEEVPVAGWTRENGRTSFSLRLAPLQAVMVYYRNETGETSPSSRDDRAVVEPFPTIDLSQNWQVTFDPRWGGPDTPVPFETLSCWTRHETEGVRYYSGEAIYQKTVEIPDDLLQEGQRLDLDLGDVREVAEVRINGQTAGVRIFPPYRVRVDPLLKAGENMIEITVTNTWNNRIVGDDLHPERPRLTKVPVKGYSPDRVREPWGEKALLPSGLFGPVRIVPVLTSRSHSQVLS